MPVTLKDIAERVGKSVPTVSRALGDFADISPETRAEVQRVAREMGYEPSATARNLKSQRTNTVTLVMSSATNLRFSDPFFGEFITGVVEDATQQGFDLSVTAELLGDELSTYLKHIRSRRTDGFIIMRTRRQDERIDLLRQQQVPFVAFGRVEGINDFHYVDEDGASGIRQVVDHLIDLGHRRIAFIAEPTTLTKSYHRLQGYKGGLNAHAIAYDPELVVEANFRQTSGRQSARQLLDLPDPPTAIITANDLLALGAMSEAQARGLEVGNDVSITGFDDIMLAEYVHPPLTTVHQPARELGAMVVRMLLQLIRKEPVPKSQVVINPKLVVRESTGPPR